MARLFKWIKCVPSHKLCQSPYFLMFIEPEFFQLFDFHACSAHTHPMRENWFWVVLSIQSIKNEKVSSLSILWINSILAHIFLYIRSINVKLKTLSWLKIERWSALIRCDKQVMLKKIDENKMMNFSHAFAHNLLKNPPCNRSKESFVFCLLVYSVGLSTGYVWHDKTSKLLERIKENENSMSELFSLMSHHIQWPTFLKTFHRKQHTTQNRRERNENKIRINSQI